MFGAFGPNLSKDDRIAVKILGDLTKYRGMDSTGVATVHRVDGKKKAGHTRFNIRVARDTVPSFTFLEQKRVKEMFDDDPFVIAGHCRQATHGSVSVANAHPFSCGHYIGMHNGVMSHMHDKKKDKTDTEHLFELINEEGIEDGIKHGMDGGSMALVFFDKSKGTLNFFRDENRPLFMARAKSGKHIFWASEKGILEYAEKNSAVKFQDIYILKPHLLNVIKLTNTADCELKEIKPVPKATVSYTGRDYHTDMSCCYQPSSTTFIHQSDNLKVKSAGGAYIRNLDLKASSVVCLPDQSKTELTYKGPGIRYLGFNNEIWDIAKAGKILQGQHCGCEVCSQRPVSMMSKVHFVGPTSYLCNSCFESEDVINTCYQGSRFYTGGLINRDGDFIVRKSSKDLTKDVIPF